MLIVHPDLLAAIHASSQTLTACAKITRRDGVVLGLTTLDLDLEIEGITYHASIGFTPSAFEVEEGVNVPNQELENLLFSCDQIDPLEFDKGIYDEAQIEVFLVDYCNLPASLSENPPKHLILPHGTLSEINRTDQTVSVEVLGKEDKFNSIVGARTSQKCRYRLGDQHCGVDLGPHTVDTTVAAVTVQRRKFTIAGFPDNHFTFGTCEFLNGANQGSVIEIAGFTSNEIRLFGKTNFIAAGDQVRLVRGCDKTVNNCAAYNNLINFGGEPVLPLNRALSPDIES